MATFEVYPHELLQLKCLLLRKQYHQCIQASSDVLSSQEDGAGDHPFSGIFAAFYLALAHDELARSMHEHSAFKLGSFEKAEQHYHQAIELLPDVERCRSILETQHRVAAGGDATQPSSPEHELPSRAVSAVVPTQPDQDEKGDSDLDSHDSFDDFLKSAAPRVTLPRQPLERDYSSMSLLNARPRLTKSTSQGLLRPIRPGSPPKAYFLPPKLPYFGQDHSSHSSRAPSPLPQTPGVTIVASTPERQPVLGEHDMDLTSLSEHLDGMRTQIKTHISLLGHAKLATTVAQAERASRSNASRPSPQTRVPHSKSFWSFTPVNVQTADKQKKIEEGKARGWERKRYRPEKCEALIENALAEL